MSDPAVLETAASRLGELAEQDAPLGALTTYRVGGRAALLVHVTDDRRLRAVIDATVATGVDTLVVGKGSNLLVADEGFAGLAIVLGEQFAAVEVSGTQVEAGAAASLPVVARRTVAAGLTGFEWAVGVPGSIGGAVRMNAGGHGSDMAAVLDGVRVADLRTGEDGWVTVPQLQLGYRTSSVRPHQLVLGARLALSVGDVERGTAELAEIVAWRRANQPGGSNAGSVFTNPPGRLRRPPDRSRRSQGPPARHRGRLGQARQLHPGRRGRASRRRARADARGAAARASHRRGRAPTRDPPGRVPPRPSTRDRGLT